MAQEKEANLLCGDAIVNYKTVQSFGNEEMLVKQYEKMLMPKHEISFGQNVFAGFGYAFSQFNQFGVFAAVFYFGALIIEADFPEANSEDIFLALFCIMFGAYQAGQASSMGPDIGRATVAASKIFRIKEEESKIDAVKMDSGEKGQKIVSIDGPADYAFPNRMIDPATVQGKVEF